MGEKKTLSGRVPADTEERFEEFRMRRGLNKTDAMRRLIEEGLDSYSETEEDSSAESLTDDGSVKIGPLTQSEEWFRDNFESALAGVFWSAPVTVVLFLLFFALQSGLNMGTDMLLMQILALLFSIGVGLFAVSLLVAVLAYLALRTGLARWLDRSGEADEKEAAG